MSGTRHLSLVTFLVVCATLCSCHTDAPSESSRAQDAAEDTPRQVAIPIRIKDRYPPWRAVEVPAVNMFASRVDSLFRAKDTQALVGLKGAAKEMITRHGGAADHHTARELGLAIMKVHSAVQWEEGADAAGDLIVSASALWDRSRPVLDSVGTELLFMKARTSLAMGDARQAVASFKTAAEQAFAREDDVRGSAFLRSAAYAELGTGNTNGAKELFHRAITMHSERKDTNLLAGTLMASIAAFPDSVGAILQRVEDLLPGVRRPVVAGFYHSRRGQYLAERERTASGLTCFKQAILTIDTLPDKSLEEAVALAGYLHNAGYASRHLGDVEGAKRFGSRAVELNEALMRVDDPLEARHARDRLAGTLEAMPLSAEVDRRYGAGAERQMSVLKLRMERKPLDSILVAKTYANIAAEYFHWDSLGLDSVLKYAGLCLEWPSRSETMAALHLTAYALLHKDEHAASLGTVERACGMFAVDPASFTWDSLERVPFPKTIRAVEQLGKFEEVLEVLQRKEPEIRDRRLLQRLSLIQSQLMDSLFMVEGSDLGKLMRSRELMTARLMRDAWPVGTAMPGNVDSVFAWMDDDKAMAFQRDRYLMEQSDRNEARAAINAAREHLGSLVDAGAGETDPAVLRTSARIDSIEALLAKDPPAAQAPTHVDMDLATRAREGIGAGTGVLIYRLTKNDVFIAYLDKDTVVLDRFARGPVFNDALSSLTDVGSGSDALSRIPPASWEAVGRLVPSAVRERLRQELIIIPSRELSYLPFETLPMGRAGELLLDRVTVRYGLAVAMLHHGVQEEHGRGQLSVLAFAPAYHGDRDAEDSRSANILLEQEQRDLAGPLLYNDDEVDAIVSTITATGLTGESANEEAFKAALGRAGVLHLAMHAFSSEQPSRSGLVFRSNDRMEDGMRAGPGDDNGIFHAYELLTRPVKAALVVLSACETGHGPHQDGEGVRSLARSFMLAGAGSTVSSLWKVDDRATKEIMVKFYEYLADGMGKADALAEAKRWYRRENPNAPPSHWAAFILIGDNEPVNLKKRSPVRPWMWLIGGLAVLLAGYGVRRMRTAA